MIGKVDLVAFGTGTVPDEVLRKAVLDVFNLRPAAIIEKLHLCSCIYADTATYGHFYSCLFPWEDGGDYFKELRKEAAEYADKKTED